MTDSTQAHGAIDTLLWLGAGVIALLLIVLFWLGSAIAALAARLRPARPSPHPALPLPSRPAGI